MARLISFNPTASARTRAAEAILGTPDLLARYAAAGGLREDLEAIRDAGLRAEALNLAQTQAQAAGGGATTSLLQGFAAVQRDYSRTMAVATAARADLARSAAPADVIAALDGILANEATVVVQTPAAPAAAAPGEPPPRRRAVRSHSQEALRAEIEKDARALAALGGARAALEARGVTAARLGALGDAARALAGRLSDRATKKGAARGATRDEREAVTAQKERWGASYRLLAQVGAADARVAALLREAAR